MKLTDLKYLAAFLIPMFVFIGIYQGGLWSFAGVAFAFVLIPIIEPLLSSSTDNYTEAEVLSRKASVFFDFLLLLNIPVIYIAVFLFGSRVSQDIYTTTELTGLVLSLGTCLGACGINVAHELGHRKSKALQFAAKVLLLPCLYQHFFIEHNRGHHLHVATPKDPATARYNEPVYIFWARSVYGCYINAWKIENKDKPMFSLKNEMTVFTSILIAYLILIYSVFTTLAASLILLAGVVSFLLLETINYIEHYGLLRNKKDNGRYERVLAKHSWNSNHYLGRIVLYELTRHSDHHFIASKEYQILEHHDDSPQLPLGYPSSMLMALVPPLWFKVMNPKVASLN